MATRVLRWLALQCAFGDSSTVGQFEVPDANASPGICEGEETRTR
jgi:hypothetical protein